jgi:hypothetical protein
MSNHPLNLGLRFFLELFALFSLGFWGWTQHAGLQRYLWGFGLPLLAAALWGTFRIPNDPGKAPIPVPGLVRLLLEALFFGGAVWGLSAAGRPGWALTFGAIVLVHYVLSYDRLLRLVRGIPA